MNDVEVKNLPEIHLVCVRAEIRTGSVIRRHIIPDLWEKLAAVGPAIPRYDHNRYALITGDLPGREEETSHYFAGIRVDPEKSVTLPEGCFHYKIEEGLVASVVHVGAPLSIGHTAMRLFRDWLPLSGLIGRLIEEFMIFPPVFDRDNPRAESEYNIFVRKA